MHFINKISLIAITTSLIIFGLAFPEAVKAATGGTFGGLIPLSKNIQGKIQNNVYFAKDGSFNVRLPHPTSSHEYTYMEINEKYNREESYVSFGPSASNRTIYRININPKLTAYSRSINVNSIIDAIFDQYAKVLNATYRCQLKVVSKSTVNLRQYKAQMCEFIEHRPSTMTLQGMTKPENVRHFVYIIDTNNYLGLISYAEPSGDSKRFSHLSEEFIQSFTISN